ncbi:hypothetical protein yc1106_06253 [Curvularia clavata]|uniref:Uncharacterized protein n=1 Tax=Curvularia clavata TaxID=95742 RepID=A0A9Q8ZCL3_CURCL|nr:hypothetical protein yc1106_06253 [Curvularia clavata]
MHSFVLFNLAAAAAAVSSPLSSQEHKVETIHTPAAKEAAPIITVVNLNRTYAIQLECLGCPFGILKNPDAVEWQHPPPGNSLMLMLGIDQSGSALFLNDKRIFPLDSSPPHIDAVQVPTNLGKEEAAWQADRAISEQIKFPLQYEHTLFRAEGGEGLWIQFNVTGLARAEGSAPFKTGHKALQILLRESQTHQEAEGQSANAYTLLIADVQVVGEKDRVQPLRMKCGRLAMIQTAFDPNEWDEHGRFGTWARVRKLIVGNLSAFWFGCVHCIDVLLPLTLLVAIGIVVVARCQSRQQGSVGGGSAAKTSLLGCHASPPYPDLPVIKIELCD